MTEDDGTAWIGERWPNAPDDPVLGGQAGLVFAEGIAPQDLAATRAA